MPVIGYMSSFSPEAQPRLLAFRQGLSEIGYTEDYNIKIEYRWAERTDTIDYLGWLRTSCADRWP